MPDGTYEFHDYMDTDGIVGNPVKIAVNVRKEGSGIEFDFEGDTARRCGLPEKHEH